MLVAFLSVLPARAAELFLAVIHMEQLVMLFPEDSVIQGDNGGIFFRAFEEGDPVGLI